MKYLDNISNFFSNKKSKQDINKKTVNDYIHAINDQFDFKKIIGSVISSLNKYDIKPEKNHMEGSKVYLFIKMFDDIRKSNKNDINHKFPYDLICYGDFDYDKVKSNFILNIKNIMNSNDYLLIDKNGKRITYSTIKNNPNQIQEFLNSKIKFATVEISIVCDRDEPDDIVFDATEFLERKHGFILNREKLEDNRLKTGRYDANPIQKVYLYEKKIEL